MIRALPRDVVDRIAAGEVVERPASVVKELIENALDARARRISVSVGEGGLGLIRVADDGTGIAEADLGLAFAAHATSKLADVGDLEHIGSFGFRGEALASIGAVSRARITTSIGTEAGGWTLACEAGVLLGPEPVATTRGTVVEIRDLFFNTPARRRFLGAARTEAARCREAVTSLALVHAGVCFDLEVDGHKRFRVDGGADLRERLAAVYGEDFVRDMVPLAGQHEGISVEGWLTLPAAAKPRPRAQHCFVNDRHVKDRALVAAVRSGCADFLPGSLQPAFVIQIHLDPARVDVNVHPTKAEVRFRERDEVFRAVRRACRDALLAANLSPRPRAEGIAARSMSPGWEAGPGPALAATGSPSSRTLPFRVESKPFTDRADRVGEALPPAVPAPAPAPVRRYLQVHDTYLVHEDPAGLVLIDQHALHERILYARLQDDLAAGRLESQRLLLPETVRLDPSDHARALGMQEELAALGLVVESFGPDTVAIHAVPAVLQHESVPDLLRALLDPPDAHGGIPNGLDRRLFTMACHAAVKAGDPLGEDEIASMLRQGEALDHDATCPHGRPTRLVIPPDELEKLFKRSGF